MLSPIVYPPKTRTRVYGVAALLGGLFIAVTVQVILVCKLTPEPQPTIVPLFEALPPGVLDSFPGGASY